MNNQRQTDPVSLAFTDGSLELMIDKLDQGEVDVAVMSAPYDIPKRFRSAALFSEPLVLALGNEHRFNGRRSIDVDELDKEPYCRRTECEVRPQIQEMLDDRNIALNVVYQSVREDWVQAFVRSNFGVAFMPLSTVKRVGLHYTHVAGDPISRVVSVYWHSERPLNPTKQSIVDMLVGHGWPTVS